MASEALQRARPFLRGTFSEIDPWLPEFMRVLREVGAAECLHKQGNFFEHLTGVYRILKLWRAPDAVARCGLFHSTYSNSYVNLAIFEPDVGRSTVRDLIGEAAEELVHMFCIVPRQSLIHDQLLFQFSGEDLIEALKESEKSVKEAEAEDLELQKLKIDEKKEGWLHPIGDRLDALKDEMEGKFEDLFLPDWRMKLQKVLPPEGIKVKHIRTGEDIQVPRRLVAVFLLMTMADFADQLFSFQDALFDNANGKLEFRGNTWKALWPGDGKPGLWITSISRMGALYNLIAREEKLYTREKKDEVREGRFEGLELVVPPVFDYCTAVLSPADQITARDLYWEAVCMAPAENTFQKAEELLQKACQLNPFIGEPHVLLAQIYNSEEKYDQGEKEAETGLRIMLEWGTNWDKRMSWEGWVAWTRVLLMKAKEKSWPQTSWGILNLGLVK
eukprot:TRINITY_DN100_c0_g1_i2.p1 TRINITY_DN100_c0_g1~~TRINITY_DN100_c0_g1_i2.p1  ORF type:complete len:445 (-),score=87.81 TRINITY_DN100_c0_g1_i2:366-1700(-)